MDSANHEKARTIAEESRSIELEEREQFVLDSCKGNEELLSEVRRLLGADHTVAVDAFGSDRTVVDSDQSMRHRSRVPKKIGQFNVRCEIGVGGMGAVYEAMQDNPKRRVAIKVLRSSMAGESARKRFEYESQVLARLKHPGIAEVYEAGTYDEGDGPMPYFAMEYIVGRKELDDYAEEKELSVEAKIRLFIEVCEALHHGHQKGVVHRDLKPGNILVDAQGRTRIIDFGVARATDSDVALATMQTEVGQIIGTVEYMSPEQCEGDPDLVDVRSDIYALGVILFELMTGNRPHDLAGSTVYEAVRVIRENSPTRMGTIDRSLRGDLETIAGKALEKDPDRRYQSALELKQDLERFLANEPIEARPPSLGYQAKMFAKRHKGTAASIVIVALVLVATTGWSLVERGRAERAANLAKDSAEQARLAEEQATRDRDIAQEAETATANALRRLEAEQARTIQAMDFLTGVFELANPANSQGRTLTMSDMLREASDQIDESFVDQPIMAADLRHKLGSLQIELGEMDDAESNLLKGLILAEREHGTSSLEALSVGVKLAGAMVEQGRLDEARSRLERILEQTEMVGEDAREFDITARHWMVQILGNELKFLEATELGEGVVADSRAFFGPDHRTTVKYEVDLAQYQIARMINEGNQPPEDYEPPFGTIQRVRSILGGDLHPYTLHARVCEIMRDFNNPDRAEDYGETIEALAGDCRLVLGDRHPRTFEILQILGIHYLQNGSTDSAIEVLSEVYDGYVDIYSPEHPSTQYAASLLGTTLINLDRPEEALPYLAASWRGLEKRWGESDVRTSQAKANYAVALMMVNRFEEANPLYEESIIFLKSLPPSLGGEAVLRMSIARTQGLLDFQHLEEARASGLQTIKRCWEQPGVQEGLRLSYAAAIVAMFFEADPVDEPGLQEITRFFLEAESAEDTRERLLLIMKRMPVDAFPKARPVLEQAMSERVGDFGGADAVGELLENAMAETDDPARKGAYQALIDSMP